MLQKLTKLDQESLKQAPKIAAVYPPPPSYIQRRTAKTTCEKQHSHSQATERKKSANFTQKALKIFLIMPTHTESAPLGVPLTHPHPHPSLIYTMNECIVVIWAQAQAGLFTVCGPRKNRTQKKRKLFFGREFPFFPHVSLSAFLYPVRRWRRGYT